MRSRWSNQAYRRRSRSTSASTRCFTGPSPAGLGVAGGGEREVACYHPASPLVVHVHREAVRHERAVEGRQVLEGPVEQGVLEVVRDGDVRVVGELQVGLQGTA